MRGIQRISNHGVWKVLSEIASKICIRDSDKLGPRRLITKDKCHHQQDGRYTTIHRFIVWFGINTIQAMTLLVLLTKKPPDGWLFIYFNLKAFFT